MHLSDPPDVSVEQDSEEVTENHYLYLTCIVEGGNPTQVDSYLWSFDGRYNNSEPRSFTAQRSKPTIFIESVSKENVGTYTCTIETEAGQAMGSKTVTVTCKP